LSLSQNQFSWGLLAPEAGVSFDTVLCQLFRRKESFAAGDDTPVSEQIKVVSTQSDGFFEEIERVRPN
jgi:hypothetical protein